jgi:multiple sugar transport system substrate-binding protein
MKNVRSVELNLWVMPNAGFQTRRLLNRLLEPFHRSHPHIQVKVWVFPWSVAWDRLMTVLKHSHWPVVPDVIQIGSTWTCTLAFLGTLKELTTGMSDIDRDNFIPTVFESCYLPRSRKLFAVPWFMDLRVLYYRRDILKSVKAGPEDLDTWDSFRRVCQAVKRARSRHRKHILAMSGQKGEVLIHDLAPWIWGAGGNFLTPDERQAAFQREDSAEGLKYFFSLMADGYIPLLGRDRFSSGNFFSGHAMFQLSGYWPFHDPKRDGVPPEVAKNFGVAPFPLGPAGRFTYLGGSHLAISTQTRYPEESWALLRYLSLPETQKQHAQAIGMLPCRPTELPELFSRHPQAGDVFLESLTYARLLPQVPLLGTLERMFVRVTSNLVKKIVEKDYTPMKLQSVLSEAAQEADYLVSLQLPS